MKQATITDFFSSVDRLEQSYLSPVSKRKVRKLAQTRWHSTINRVKGNMYDLLGEHQWNAFLRYVTRRHKERFLKEFFPQTNTLICSGNFGGMPCPNSFRVNLHRNLNQLRFLHLDHDTDLKRTCETWSESLSRSRQNCWAGSYTRSSIGKCLFGELTFRCSLPDMKVRALPSSRHRALWTLWPQVEADIQNIRPGREKSPRKFA
jgi:hypothetical protein